MAERRRPDAADDRVERKRAPRSWSAGNSSTTKRQAGRTGNTLHGLEFGTRGEC